MPRELMTADEAAEYLRLHRDSVRRLARAGALPLMRQLSSHSDEYIASAAREAVATIEAAGRAAAGP